VFSKFVYEINSARQAFKYCPFGAVGLAGTATGHFTKAARRADFAKV
jgi:hypothetical protein